jgi:hypothetical protein
MVRGLEQRQLLFDMDMSLLKLRQARGEKEPCGDCPVGHVPQPAAHVGRCVRRRHPAVSHPTKMLLFI